jgi:hypothetical protein
LAFFLFWGVLLLLLLLLAASVSVSVGVVVVAAGVVAAVAAAAVERTAVPVMVRNIQGESVQSVRCRTRMGKAIDGMSNENMRSSSFSLGT